MKPITRKEMFLAQAAGDEAPELTPITREEMFLDRIGKTTERTKAKVEAIDSEINGALTLAIEGTVGEEDSSFTINIGDGEGKIPASAKQIIVSVTTEQTSSAQNGAVWLSPDGIAAEVRGIFGAFTANNGKRNVVLRFQDDGGLLYYDGASGVLNGTPAAVGMAGGLFGMDWVTTGGTIRIGFYTSGQVFADGSSYKVWYR